VVIVEDQALLSDMLAATCRRELGFETVAVEATGQAGLEAVRRLSPELLLLDISLPDIDGLDVAAVVRRELPAVRILAFSSHREPRTIRRVRELGLHGFFDKQEQTLDRLKEAIERVMDGRGYFSPVFGVVVESLQRDALAYHRILSDYEQTVLGLIGEAKADPEIAVELGIQPSTAQSRRRDIMGKLGIHSTPKLIRYAIENGFTRPDRF
jgi:DNA-binding NarL/FixJ family response regulator